MLTRGFFEIGVAKLIAAVGVTVAALAASLLAPDIAHAYEVHVSITGAGQVTETTQANLVGSGCVTSAANPTGTVGIDCYPGSPDGAYGWGWTVRYVATPKPGYRFVQWQSDGSPKPVICDGANGSSTYTGSACQFATYDNLQTRAVFVDDTNPAVASLTGPNQVVNGQAAFYFSASADPTFRRFECRVAGVHDWQSCSSGTTEDPGTGTYTFQVRAVDWSGNLSAESSWDWTVDKVTPGTSLTSGPDGTVADTSATFRFTSNESGDFVCSLDGVKTGCTSPKSYEGLVQGTHTFQVSARDVAGNLDPTPASRTWTVDTTLPGGTVSINGGNTYTRSTTVNMTLSADDTGSGLASMRFSNDGVTWSNWEPYATGRSWTLGSGDGVKTVRVQYKDGAGNVGSAQDSITLDTINPAVVSVTPAALANGVAPTANVTATFSEAMKMSTLTGTTFTLVRKGTTEKIPATVGYSSASQKATLNPTNNLVAGVTYTATVKTGAKDLAGNALAGNKVWNFTVRR